MYNVQPTFDRDHAHKAPRCRAQLLLPHPVLQIRQHIPQPLLLPRVLAEFLRTFSEVSALH